MDAVHLDALERLDPLAFFRGQARTAAGVPLHQGIVPFEATVSIVDLAGPKELPGRAPWDGARGLQRIARQVQRLGAVRLGDAGVADQPVS